MLSSRRVWALALLAVTAVLAGANAWFAAARSTIPFELEDRVERKERRREKRPGRDDVHLLHMASGQTLVVDRRVFDAVSEGETVIKEAWSRALRHGTLETRLNWSADARGMWVVMPLIWGICLALGLFRFRVDARPSEGDIPVNASGDVP